jgi:hypothetical protein
MTPFERIQVAHEVDFSALLKWVQLVKSSVMKIVELPFLKAMRIINGLYILDEMAQFPSFPC